MAATSQRASEKGSLQGSHSQGSQRVPQKGSLQGSQKASRKVAVKLSRWCARIAFAAVFAVNVWCAVSFIVAPGDFAGAYELAGVSGEAAVRGIGIAFLMWNATYPAFIATPERFPVLGWVIIAQQVIGLVGESLLLIGLPAGHDVLAASVLRFIAFDGGGLVLMAAAFTWFLVSRRWE